MARTLHLSVADQCVARVYIQTLSLFPFPDDSQRESAVQAIERGLQETLEILPFFAGTVGPADPHTGELSLAYQNEVPHAVTSDIFAYDVIPFSRDGFAYTYERLRKAGMPQSAFTGKRFCPKALRGRPGIPEDAEGIMSCEYGVPALAVQAFFIPGGLVLSVYFHHSVVDGSGMTEFWRHFSAGVYYQTHLRPSSIEPIVHQSALRKQVDAGIPKFDQPPQADAYGVPNYERTLPDGTPCSSKLFVFSAARIREFRDQIQDRVSTVTPMTRCNVLAALIWIHVTRARHARLVKCGYRTTSIGVAVDLRKRIKPQLPPAYVGNMAMMTTATTSISGLTAEPSVTNATIIPTIQSINTAISNVNDTWVQRHLSYFKSLQPITNTELKLRFNTGPDLYVSSWLHFGADFRWDIPGTTSSTPEFIRRTHSSSDGGIILMPRKAGSGDGKEAPYEVLVRLATEDMDRLLNEEDGLATRWADRVVG